MKRLLTLILLFILLTSVWQSAKDLFIDEDEYEWVEGIIARR